MKQSYYEITMKLDCIIMSDIKTARVDIFNHQYKGKSRNKFLTELDENNIKYTFIQFKESIMCFVIFDTDNDLMLFKLKFNDRIDKENVNYTMELYDRSYLIFKEEMAMSIEEYYNDILVFTKSPKNDMIEI